jgi:hypothetical protein
VILQVFISQPLPGQDGMQTLPAVWALQQQFKVDNTAAAMAPSLVAALTKARHLLTEGGFSAGGGWHRR